MSALAQGIQTHFQDLPEYRKRKVRPPVSSMTSAPCVVGAVRAFSRRSFFRQAFTALASQQDSDRNHWRGRARVVQKVGRH